MKILKAIVLTFSVAAVINVSGQENPEGKSFSISVTEVNADGRIEKMDPDILSFSEGFVNTKFSEKNGFKPATVKSDIRDAETHFSGTSTGEDGIELIWEGIIRGADVEGSATRKGGKNSGAVYQFRGTLQ